MTYLFYICFNLNSFIYFVNYLGLADLPSSHELSSYYSREDERGAHRVIRDTDPIGASYDRYLRSSVLKFILLQIGIHVG